MRKNSLPALALLAISLPCVTAVAADRIATAGDLAAIQASTIILKARVNEAQARADLNAKNGIGSDGDGTLPVVKSIVGNERNLVVTFLFPGNVKVPASVGDIIPGGYVVAKINEEANTVQLLKGKDKFVVGYSSTVPTTKQAGQSQVVVPAYTPALTPAAR